jgi:hypothetical protein
MVCDSADNGGAARMFQGARLELRAGRALVTRQKAGTTGIRSADDLVIDNRMHYN